MNGRPKFEPNHSRSLGIERTEQKILVCKAEMRRKFIDVDAPRLTPQVLARLRYRGSVARYFRWTTYDIRPKLRLGDARCCGIVR
jgi:hypothetical protein